MKLVKRIKEKQFSKTFILMSFIGLFLVLIAFFVSGGNLISKYFFRDELDTGMDFFNSVTYVSTRSPYDEYNVVYSPFANLIYYIIYFFVRNKTIFPGTFELGVLNRGTPGDLRLFQSISLIYLLYIFIITYFISIISDSYINNQKPAIRKMVFFSVLFSYGTVFAYERGNIIVLCFANLLMFLSFYNSSNKLLKELSLLSLACAFGLKLYPAIFGLLLLKEKDYKSAIRTAIYGIIVIIVPSLIFKEGIFGIFKWISNVIVFSGRSADFTGNTVPQLLSAINNGATVFSSGSITIINATLIILLFLSLLVMNSNSDYIIVLSLLMVITTTQANYVYMFYNIPILALIKYKNKIENKFELAKFLLLLLLTINLPIFDAYFYSFVRGYCTLFLVIIMLLNAVYCAKHKISEIKK